MFVLVRRVQNKIFCLLFKQETLLSVQCLQCNHCIAYEAASGVLFGYLKEVTQLHYWWKWCLKFSVFMRSHKECHRLSYASTLCICLYLSVLLIIKKMVVMGIDTWKKHTEDIWDVNRYMEESFSKLMFESKTVCCFHVFISIHKIIN